MDEIEFRQLHDTATEATQGITDLQTNQVLLALLAMVGDLNERLLELQSEEDDEDE